MNAAAARAARWMLNPEAIEEPSMNPRTTPVAAVRRAARSYTLIELLIVVGVLGLAAAILAPQLVARDAMMVQAAVRLIIADVAYAQSDALANQEYRLVYFWPDGRQYSLVRWDPSEPWAPPAALPGTADILVHPMNGTEYTVNFQTDGRFDLVNFDMGAGAGSSHIDGADGQPDGLYLIFDSLGGIVSAADITAPGLGGNLVIVCEDERYEIVFSAFTGKMTVNKLSP